MRDQKLSLNRSSLKARQDYLLEAEEGTLNLPSEFKQIGTSFGSTKPYDAIRHLHVIQHPNGQYFLVASSYGFDKHTHHVMKIVQEKATQLMGGGSNMNEEELQGLHNNVVIKAEEPYKYMLGGEIGEARMTTQELLAYFGVHQPMPKYESTRTPRFSKLINEIANHITEEQDKRDRLLGETYGDDYLHVTSPAANREAADETARRVRARKRQDDLKRLQHEQNFLIDELEKEGLDDTTRLEHTKRLGEIAEIIKDDHENVLPWHPLMREYHELITRRQQRGGDPRGSEQKVQDRLKELADALREHGVHVHPGVPYGGERPGSISGRMAYFGKQGIYVPPEPEVESR